MLLEIVRAFEADDTIVFTFFAFCIKEQDCWRRDEFEMLQQGKANLQAPWLGITAFAILSIMLTLLIFIFEGVRDAFDPRKSIAANGGGG